MSGAAHPIWKVEAQLTGVLVKPGYIEIVGDRIAAQLLSQIVFWFRPGKNGKSKLRIVRNGRLCLVKHRAELAAEAGISLKQYTRAIRILLDEGFVEQEVHLFKGKTAVFTWLNTAKLQFELEEFQKLSTKTAYPGKPFGKKQKLPKGDSKLCPSGTAITDSTKKNLSDTIFAAAPHAATAEHHQSTQSPSEDDQFNPSYFQAELKKLKLAGLASVAVYQEASALSAKYAASKSKVDRKACTHALLMLWRQEVQDHCKNAPPVSFSPKQVGCMAYSLDVILANGIDPAALICDSIRNWGSLSWLIKSNAGLESNPCNRPKIEFWTPHLFSAVQRFKACASAEHKEASTHFKQYAAEWCALHCHFDN